MSIPLAADILEAADHCDDSFSGVREADPLPCPPLGVGVGPWSTWVWKDTETFCGENSSLTAVALPASLSQHGSDVVGRAGKARHWWELPGAEAPTHEGPGLFPD